jgi:exodeoxyribonuclease X
MKAFIFDTETTGFNDPDALEVGHTEPFAFGATDLTVHVFKYNTLKPIEFGAMATHHILPGMHRGQPMWPGRWEPSPEGEYAIGHNVDFDAGVVKLPDSVKRICTMHLARKQYPQLDSHSLGALAYFNASLTGEMEIVRNVLKNHAHSAAQDVQTTYIILNQLLKDMPTVGSWEELYQRSEMARVPERMSFGKYGPDQKWGKENGGVGMLCSQIRSFDYGYYQWLLNDCDRVTEDPYLRRALVGS